MRETPLDRIQARLNALGISETAASRLATGSTDTIRNIRRSWNKTGRLSATARTLDALARVLETTTSWIADGEGKEEGNTRKFVNVPLISWVAASSFAEVQSVDVTEADKFIEVSNLEDGEYIALEVRGDSMNLVAPDGSIIIVNRRDKDLVDKKFYVALTENGGETTFKRYRADTPRRLTPYSTNLDHNSISLEEPVRIIGRVIRVINEL